MITKWKPLSLNSWWGTASVGPKGYLVAQEGETILVEAEAPALPLLPHLKRAFLKRGVTLFSA